MDNVFADITLYNEKGEYFAKYENVNLKNGNGWGYQSNCSIPSMYTSKITILNSAETVLKGPYRNFGEIYKYNFDDI